MKDSPLNVRVTEPQPNAKSRVWISLALGLLTLALYLPSVRHEFLDYDDQQYVTENLRVRAGLTADGFIWAFGFHAGNWHPLAWLSHMLDCQLYGLNAGGHHLTNVLLHTANSVALFLALAILTQCNWRSAVVAALFAWHPAHVESVAWIAERKDLLCAFFWMLTLLAYAWYAARTERPATVAPISKSAVSRVSKPADQTIQSAMPIGNRRYSRLGNLRYNSAVQYSLTLALFALALMSKPMAVTLPFVLLLLDFWPLRRFGQLNPQSTVLKLFAEKIPFFAMSALACWLTLGAQRAAIVSTRGLPIAERIAHAAQAYAHYIGTLLAPHKLAVHYPYDSGSLASALFGAALILVLTVIAIFFARSRGFAFTGWFWFVGTLVPVIGLVQVGDQAWADRYTYLPSVGFFVCIVWLGAELISNARVRIAFAALVCCAAAVLSSLQLRHWRNTQALFEHADAVTEKNHLAATLLGSLKAREGKLDEAMACYQRALSYRSNYAEVHFFIGHAFEQQGKFPEAIAEYRRALASGPMREQTHIFLGAALARQKQTDEAALHYRAALEINPESAVAHNNLARLLHAEGKLDEAEKHYSMALKLDPAFAQAHNNFGVLLLQRNDPTNGVAHLREAARLNPNDTESQLNLALGLNQLGQWREAGELFSKTVTASTQDANAHSQFAVALGHLKKTKEAMSHYASALLLRPDFPEALDGLAWILATSDQPEFRNGGEAVKMAERANELTGRKDAAKLRTLAAAYAEAGRFDEALGTLQIARQFATGETGAELAKQLGAMADQFRAAHPWRQAE